MRAVCNNLVHRPMLLIRVLNACHHFPCFVYERARLRQELNTIEVQVRPRRGSKARCSSCQRPAPGYDRLPERRFEFIPLWGFTVVLLYAMRRVECRHCGVKVEQVPWARGKHTLTDAYMLFLAHWARKLSWKETARSFHTSWDKVYQAVEYVVQWGLEHRELGCLRLTRGHETEAPREPLAGIGPAFTPHALREKARRLSVTRDDNVIFEIDGV